MAKVEQKVSLDATEYRTNLRKMSEDTKKDTNKINDALNESGNSVRDFNDRVTKNTGKSLKSFDDIGKGVTSLLGPLARLATAGGAISLVGGVAAKAIGGRLSFEERLNVSAQRNDFSEFEQSDFGNKISRVSQRTNVDKEILESSATIAKSLIGSADEAIKFTEVLANMSKSLNSVSEEDLPALSKSIATDLKIREGSATAGGAKRTFEAVALGRASGLGSGQEVLSLLKALPSQIQKRAGLSQRRLVELSAGGLGVQADPENVVGLLRDLIINTDPRRIESLGFASVVGANFRDSEGKLDITAENLKKVSERLKGLGSEAVSSNLLKENITSFRQESIEALLAITKNPKLFTQAVEKAESRKIDTDQIVKTSTSGFLESISRFGNAFINELQIDKTFQKGQTKNVGGTAGLFGIEVPTGLTDEELEREKSKKGFLSRSKSFPSSSSPTEKQINRTPPSNNPFIPGNQNIKLELISSDPHFKLKLKGNDLARDPQGF